MFQIHSKSSLKTALLLGAATATAMSLTSAAMAQEQVETVVVTGSRIPQVGVYSSSPVTAVTNQEIKYEGTTNVEPLLNNLPSAFADFGSYESNGSPGTATVNLSVGAGRLDERSAFAGPGGGARCTVRGCRALPAGSRAHGR